MTRISAIITTYNVETFVATAMQSIIDAGFDDLELILVDDGSRDATRVVAERTAAAAPAHRVRYVPLYFSQNSIGGVASAANAGLDQVSGEIVIFVDGDDWVIPHTLRQATERLIRSQNDFTVCGCQEFWNGQGTYTLHPEQHLWEQVTKIGSIESRRNILLQMAPFPWRKIYRRAFLEHHQIRFPVGNYFFEDNPFHWETTTKADAFDFFSPVTHVHRMNRSGQTVTNMGTTPLQIFDHALTIRNMLQSNDREANWEEQFFDWLVNHILWCCRHVSPSGLNLLFDRAAAENDRISDANFAKILARKSLTIAEVQQLTAIRIRDRMAFLQAIRPMN